MPGSSTATTPASRKAAISALADVHEVVGRDAAELGGEQSAARAGELVGVQLGPQPSAMPACSTRRD